MMKEQERVRLIHYPVKYTRIPAGCLGRLAGWPEAVTGGAGSGRLPGYAPGRAPGNDPGLSAAG